MTSTTVDRPAAIRRALRDLVAENGFHGTSMSAVARRAGVAAGTAYVHYESKEELVYATYLEIKRDLGRAVLERLDPSAEPRTRYEQIWHATHDHLREEPERAAFLMQLEVSPFFASAHERLLAEGDLLLEEASRADIVALLVDLPDEVIYSLSLGAAVRLVAAGITLEEAELGRLVDATWRAITRAS